MTQTNKPEDVLVKSSFVLLFLILLISLTLGCMPGGGSTRKTSSIRSAKNVKSSAAELSSRNQSILSLYSGQIEGAADKIILQSQSPVARRQALVWKAEAIPVLQTALLNTDPVAAVLDTWVFLFQMTAYMNQPELQQRFGDSHAVVVETLRNMDSQMSHLIQQGAPNAKVADIGQKARSWADAHPIQTSLAGRQSVDAEVIRRVGESDMGTMASIQALGESLGDLTARMDSYNVYLPKQARWQAELLLRDVASDPQVKTTLSNVAVLSTALAKTSNNLGRMPEIMGQTRQAINADITGQRLATQAFLRNERLETIQALQHERVAAVAALDQERLAATTDLRGERQILLNELQRQQASIVQSVNAATEKAIQDVDRRSRSLIDHFFVRALELVLFTLALCALIGWILLRRFAPFRRQQSFQQPYDRAA
jgi:hypothetical protein